jgi:tetratricopeptide (TPR) repeat protein
MYNVVIAVGAGVIVFAVVAALLSPWAAIVPAVLVVGGAMFFLARRVNRLIEADMAKLPAMLEARQIQEAEAHLRGMQERYGKWQLMLDGQLEAQLGMLDYLQLKFDDALPKLEKGSWRNAHALICVGAIHYRRGRKEQAWEALEKAQNADSKELMGHLVHAVLRAKSGDRDGALAAIATGLEALPDHAQLVQLRNRVANKKKIDVKQLPQTWYQFFPEDLQKQMLVRGRKGGPHPNAPQMPQQRIGARSAPRR